MCQLFGLSSARPVSPWFSLQGFFQRGGGTGEHADGWGVAYYDKGQSRLCVQESPAYTCTEARAMLEQPFKTTTVIAHVRKATFGAIARNNTHPFMRRLWGRDWIFAHNGDLHDYRPDHRRFIPDGDTDSERAFCYLLDSMSDCFGDTLPDRDGLLDFLKDRSERVAQYGVFNYLLSDGDILVAYCSTELYWTRRRPPFSEVELLDGGYRINLAEYNDAADAIVVIATKPLTKGEAWHPMGRHEMRIFANGDEWMNTSGVRRDSGGLPTIHVRGWSDGWRAGRIALI